LQQTEPVVQLRPHAPQFAASFFVSSQWPLQQSFPAPQGFVVLQAAAHVPP
jgi:hypothetical protein